MAKEAPVEKLIDLLGFDPVRQGLSKEVVEEALGQIKSEQKTEAVAKAKEQLAKAMELRRKMDTAERNFTKEKAKFEKELGGILKALVKAAQGEAEPEDEGGGGNGEDNQDEGEGSSGSSE